MCKAVEAVAHAFSTFTTGTLEMPIARATISPRIMSWPSICPWTQLPKKMASTSPAVHPASEKACDEASAQSIFRLLSNCFPNGVIPTPMTNMSVIR
jgi:hypothetical protein